MKKAAISISLLLFIFSLTSFQKQNEKDLTIEDLKQMEIDKQLERYTSKRMATCYRIAIEKAGVIVDSILIDKAQSMMLVDSLTKPPKPNKPATPLPKIVEDTTPIAPLLKDSVLEKKIQEENKGTKN